MARWIWQSDFLLTKPWNISPLLTKIEFSLCIPNFLFPVYGLSLSVSSALSLECFPPFVTTRSGSGSNSSNVRALDNRYRIDLTIFRKTALLFNSYKDRSNTPFREVISPPIKEPASEAETALLQAMNSSKHERIDFIFSNWNMTRGVDIIVDFVDKGLLSMKWAELISSLDNLHTWDHPQRVI